MVTSRRDLLSRLIKPSDGPLASEGASLGAYVRARRVAMAAHFDVLFAPDEPGGEAAACAALDEIGRMEDQLTIYRDASEMCALNRTASASPFQPDRRLFDLLLQCEQLWRDTHGAFDITATPLAKCWGFFRRQGRFPEPEELAHARSSVGMEHVVLNQEEESVRFIKSGIEISLGSIGKGYALDRAAAVLRERGLQNVLLHGGHSSVLALGSPAWEDGWLVAVDNPLDSSKPLFHLHLREMAMGTSGIGQQFFEHQGRRYGHILDPRTGYPAEGMLSVTVFAPSAAVADALATAFFIGGIALAQEYCDTHPEVGALLLPAPSKLDQPPQVSLAGSVPESLEVFV